MILITLEECNDVYLNLYFYMSEGFDLSSIKKHTGYKKSFILKVLKKENFHRYVNHMLVYKKIFNEKDPSIMEGLLDSLRFTMINKPADFSDPDDYVRDFYYVDNHWVKKDINGRIVERLECIKDPEHFNDEWVQILRQKHDLLLSEYFV